MATKDVDGSKDPNPSVITQAAIEKSIEAAFGVITARIDGMEKAQELFQADLTRVPTTVDRQITSLRELLETRLSGMDGDLKGIHNSLGERGASISKEIVHLHDLTFGKIEELAAVTTERFEGIKSQFLERDTRTDQRAGDTKLAVDAAFAAAKEATAKIEAGFTKQIDSMVSIIDTKTSNLSGVSGDIKDRLTALENRTVGMTNARVDSRDYNADQRGNLALIVSALGVVVLVALHFVH